MKFWSDYRQKTVVNCRPKWLQKQAQIVTNLMTIESGNSMLSLELITKTAVIILACSHMP